jgi:hypothetical protein
MYFDREISRVVIPDSALFSKITNAKLCSNITGDRRWVVIPVDPGKKQNDRSREKTISDRMRIPGGNMIVKISCFTVCVTENQWIFS